MRIITHALPAYVAGLVVAVLVFGQLATLLHRAFVTHAQCEHGEFVHLEAGTAAPARGPGSGYERDTTAPAVHAHEHCAAAAFLPASTAPQSPRAAVVAPQSVTRLVECSLRPRADVGSIYSFAPKTSPPAAG